MMAYVFAYKHYEWNNNIDLAKNIFWMTIFKGNLTAWRTFSHKECYWIVWMWRRMWLEKLVLLHWSAFLWKKFSSLAEESWRRQNFISKWINRAYTTGWLFYSVHGKNNYIFVVGIVISLELVNEVSYITNKNAPCEAVICNQNLL